MNTLIFRAILAVILTASSAWASAQDAAANPQPNKPTIPGEHPPAHPCGPPPEAYKACEGKTSGSRAEFASPRGDAVKGSCELDGSEKIVLRPDRPPGEVPPGHREPPPEAYAACLGKSAGTKSQLTTPWGETVNGSCVERDGKLVLRPDRPPQKTAEEVPKR